MSAVEEFIASQSEEVLDLCTKEQLLKIAEHYDIDFSNNMLKERQKAIVRSSLIEKGVLAENQSISLPLRSMSTSNLTFEQQRELLSMQIGHERFKVKVEIDRDLAVEKMRQETMQAKLELEFRLETDKEGAADGTDSYAQSTSFSSRGISGFDVVGNLRLVPKFCKRDPDSFFVFFE